MKRALCVFGIATCVFFTNAAAQTQPQIEWKQTINLPKGLNQPPGVKVDIMGIELGDTYAEVKAKLQKLAAEVAPHVRPAASPPPAVDPSSLAAMDSQVLGTSDSLNRREQDIMGGVSNLPPYKEMRTQFNLRTPGGFLSASYTGQISLERELPGTGSQKIRENYEVWLSAPSSGHQVIGIKRFINYRNKDDQPRVSELMASLAQKLRATPQALTGMFRFQFNDGRPFVPANANNVSCRIGIGANSPEGAAIVNKSGDCDVVMDINVGYGMSNDHASSLTFTLNDNERTKQNVLADFAFFQNYTNEVQSRNKGVAPKL